MQTNNKNENDNQINAAIAANIQTAIALWEAKDWRTYKTTRDALLSLIRSGRGGEVGIKQMQFIYFVNTHLRTWFALPTSDQQMFLATTAEQSKSDKAWNTATEGEFWEEYL